MAHPKQIHPQLARDNPFEEPFKQPNFVLQEKFDGTRILAIKQGGRWYLMTRHWKNDVASKFPEIVHELNKIQSNDVVLDGELTFFDKHGKGMFLTVLAGPETKKGLTAKLMVFDIIRYNKDVAKMPLLERLALLNKIIPKDNRYLHVVKTITKPAQFKQAYTAITKNNGEGVIIKKKDEPYRFDTRETWIKVKREYTEDCVVIGITHGLGKRAATFGALVLAQYDRNGKLKIVGKASGFDDITMYKFYSMFMKQPAYSYPGLVLAGVKKWVAPKLVVEVRYFEKTPYGI